MTDVSGTDKVKRTPAEQKKSALLKTLDRKFENPDAHYELGQLYQSERRWIKAEYHYNVALSFDPIHREAQAAMVKLFFDSEDTAKAKTYADIYMNQVVGSASGSFRLGFAFQKQLLDEYAFDCYMQALQLAPNSAKVHRQLGYYYLAKNDKVRGEEYLKRSFQQYSTLDTRYWMLAESRVENQVSRIEFWNMFFFIAPWRKDALRGFFHLLFTIFYLLFSFA